MLNYSTHSNVKFIMFNYIDRTFNIWWLVWTYQFLYKSYMSNSNANNNITKYHENSWENWNTILTVILLCLWKYEKNLNKIYYVTNTSSLVVMSYNINWRYSLLKKILNELDLEPCAYIFPMEHITWYITKNNQNFINNLGCLMCTNNKIILL